MIRALIGHTGFVGGWLARSGHFDLLVNRANLESLGGEYASVLCAGLPAAKWIANRDPAADRTNMLRLCRALERVRTAEFILISTIDVYPRTTGLDERHDCSAEPNHAYGRHRLEFEHFVRERFPHALIIRLPALFGPGLRKNVIYDLLNRHQVERINPASRFQWYPLERLASDIARMRSAAIELVNLFTEPLATRVILDRCFPGIQPGAEAAPLAQYDLRTRHAAAFGGSGGYVMDAEAVLDALAEFCRTPS